MDEITERWPKKKEINDKNVNSQVANSQLHNNRKLPYGEGR